MNPAYREFEFDLPGALLARLIDVLDGLDSAPLTTVGLDGVPDQQGVYQLFFDGTLVYIGKTDAEAGLRRRLERHSRKILQRVGLSPERVSYKAVRIFVFTAIDLETQLIQHYARDGGTAWNNSGFGANDPGRNRDRTKIRGKNFDAMFPIDIDRTLEFDFASCASVAELLQRLKTHLPYTLRFEAAGRSRPHEDLTNTPISLANVTPTARGLLVAAVQRLPSGWQATALRSHLLLYKENEEKYPDAEILARS